MAGAYLVVATQSRSASSDSTTITASLPSVLQPAHLLYSLLASRARAPARRKHARERTCAPFNENKANRHPIGCLRCQGETAVAVVVVVAAARLSKVTATTTSTTTTTTTIAGPPGFPPFLPTAPVNARQTCCREGADSLLPLMCAGRRKD